MGKNCLIGRQPIISINERVVAYELLFRAVGTAANKADVRNATFSTANVINNTITNFGIENLLGDRNGFINLDYELLMSDVLELLPKQQIVLELLENLEVTPELVERCRDLKAQGFALALDDHEYSPQFHELYKISDIVKIDLIQTPIPRLPEMVRQLRSYPVKLLAEKVETRAQFMACRHMRFDLFQGYFFAKPSVLEKRQLGESGALLLRLMHLLYQDADTKDIEDAIKGSSSLTYKLLLLANSAAYAAREKITSIHQALALIGRNQVKRWVQLAFFATDENSGGENPLVDMAAVRGALMEQLAGFQPRLSSEPDGTEKAFLTGILSLLARIYNIPLDELNQRLNPGDDVIGALAEHEGVYGKLLTLAEKNEAMDFDAVAELLDELGISVDSALQSQLASYAWGYPVGEEDREDR